MANRKRRSNAGSSRSVSHSVRTKNHPDLAQQRRFSSAESPPPHRTGSSRPHTRLVHPNDSNVFLSRHPSIRPNAQHRLSQRAHSISGAASTFKASIHNNPFLASRCRVLKSQTAHLKQRLEELITSIEELQPEQSAMDWAASAGTVVYVPYPVAKDNEAPKTSLPPPQIMDPAGSTFPDALQYFRKTNPFRFGNETKVSGTTGYRQAPVQSQPQLYRPTNSGLEGSTVTVEMATRSRTTTEPPRQAAWAGYSRNTSSFGKTGGQREPVTGDGTSRTIIPQTPVTGPSASHPRHAYVEDETPEA
jgi:hypothetical protein